MLGIEKRTATNIKVLWDFEGILRFPFRWIKKSFLSFIPLKGTPRFFMDSMQTSHNQDLDIR